MNSPDVFPPESISVKPAENGQVAVTVLLPADLVRDYCRFVESLSTFFTSVKRLSYLAQSAARNNAPDFRSEADKTLAAYRARLVKSFDAYTLAGHDRKEAVKRIVADLRAEQHPWRCPDLVRSELVAAGRPGTPGRPRRGVR